MGGRPALPPCLAGLGFRVPHSCAAGQRWVPTLWDAGETRTVLWLFFLMLPGTACCTPHRGWCSGLCGQHTLAVPLCLAQASGRNPPSSPLWEAGGDRPWVITSFLLLAGQSTAFLLALWLHVALVNTAWREKPPSHSVYLLFAQAKRPGAAPLAMPSSPPSRHLGEVSWWSWNCPLHKCCHSTGLPWETPPVCFGNTKHNWCV